MKKLIIAIILMMFVMFRAQAEAIDCFIVKENKQYLIKEGAHCDVMYSPNSTFKIPLALIGFESRILKNRHNPIWQPQQPVTFLQYYHDGEQTPSSWMRFSMPWYSQMLTQKLGMKKFQAYIDKLNYGNKDLSGDKGKNNGLTDSWLSSSLLISPLNQLEFIEKLAKNRLPFSKESQIKTKDLMKLMEESLYTNGWSLHGKTGSGGYDKNKRREGYFVGFAEKDDRVISFVIHMSGNIGDKKSKVGGVVAKKIAFERMNREVFVDQRVMTKKG